ncbi:PucR family transcriptional regulator [Streptomyces sp. NPDC048211]|uniref:PucR family transcriptional regulator n=1 Tax=Streptomyces sp. NPDC048211 TaxID=3365516 RepID=UPI00371A08D2
MHVEHLLNDESLGLRPLWADDALLRNEISGVTVTDLEQPARFVRPGEVVLTGLVWWTPVKGQGRAERFVSALKQAGAAVLLAGEETRGSVPDDVIQACARHGIPVAAVPAHVMFRAVTERVYLQQWGELSRRHALPEHIRDRLSRLVAQNAGPDAILTTAFAHLADAAVAYVLTPAGRTVSATKGADALAAHEAVRLLADGTGVTVPVDSDTASPYERWHLYLPDAAPPRLLHEVAAVLSHCQKRQARHRAAEHQAAEDLGALLAGADGDATGVEDRLRAAGLPAHGPYRVITAATGERRPGRAAAALDEALACSGPGPAAVGRLPDGTAFAVVPEAAVAVRLAEIWSRVAAGDPLVPLHGGIGSPAAGPDGLAGALAESRYALASARSTAPDTSLLTDASALTSLGTLLSGVPAEVRTVYSRTVLGPLLDIGSASAAPLLETLRTFLACDGSWARTAEALHLHVNTVHYRVRRIEHFTGRDLSRLTDRLDLSTALLCHADGVMSDRCARSSAATAR